LFTGLKVDKPDWFEIFAYWGDEISFFSQAMGVSETVAANAAGEFYINELVTAEIFTASLNHEANHLVVNQENNSPMNIYLRKPRQQKYTEIVVELLTQINSSGKLEYPTKEDRMEMFSYQEGVEELVKVLKEIDQHAGVSKVGLRLLVEGVVDYNLGVDSYPLEGVFDYYQNNIKDDLSDRLSQYRDIVYSFGKIEKLDISPNTMLELSSGGVVESQEAVVQELSTSEKQLTLMGEAMLELQIPPESIKVELKGGIERLVIQVPQDKKGPWEAEDFGELVEEELVRQSIEAETGQIYVDWLDYDRQPQETVIRFEMGE